MIQKTFLRIDSDQIDIELFPDDSFHFFNFIFSEESVVDQHTDQILPDGLIEQYGTHQ